MELVEGEDALIFKLHNKIPFVNKSLVVKHRNTGKRLVIKFSHGEAVLSKEDLRTIGELGVYDIYLKADTFNRAFLKRTRFDVQNRVKALIDKENHMIFEAYPTVHSSLSFVYKSALFRSKAESLENHNDFIRLKGRIELFDEVDFDKAELLVASNRNRHEYFDVDYEISGDIINFSVDIQLDDVTMDDFESFWRVDIRLKKDNIILYSIAVKADELNNFTKREDKLLGVVDKPVVDEDETLELCQLFYTNKDYNLRFRIISKEKAKDIIKNARDRDLFNEYMETTDVDRRLIFFESFHGKYSNSPKYIYQKLLELGYGNKYKFVWSYDGDEEIPGNPIIVKSRSEEYYKYLAQSKYWINNTTFAVENKKKGVYLQTWHGTPLKRLGYDITVENPGITWGHFNKESKNWNYLISANEYSTKTFRRAFKFKKTILEYGYPANDVFYLKDDSLKNSIKEKLNIPDNKKVILYAPTFRDDSKDKTGNRFFNINLDLEKIYNNFKEDYILLIKTHSVISDNLDLNKEYEGFIYDLSNYDDIHELFLISDILVTDYSSVFFDFAHSRRPILFFTPDMENYIKERGVYREVIDDLPGPQLLDNDELVKAIENIDLIKERYAEKYNFFYDKYCSFGQGESSKKVVDLLFKDLK